MTIVSRATTVRNSSMATGANAPRPSETNMNTTRPPAPSTSWSAPRKCKHPDIQAQRSFAENKESSSLNRTQLQEHRYQIAGDPQKPEHYPKRYGTVFSFQNGTVLAFETPNSRTFKELNPELLKCADSANSRSVSALSGVSSQGQIRPFL